jgi:predicted O-methyltransferase YrrM
MKISNFLNQQSYKNPNLIVESAWLEHGAFAQWIVSEFKPRVLVELGTHNGFSYFCFCQAIQSANLSCSTYAIDTWLGDEHAGFYSEETFQKVRLHNSQYYSNFSTLIRSTFHKALEGFTNSTIDLLHIDGLHTYEAVKEDFENWLPKMTDIGLVMFHDINVRERNFGVFRLWEELKMNYKSFEFRHGHGLGILKVGQGKTTIDHLFDVEESSSTYLEIQNVYSALGKRIELEYKLSFIEPELIKMTIDRDAWVNRYNQEINEITEKSRQ